MKRNDEVEILINSLDSLGQGVGRLEGAPVFVPKTLPNELVKVKILKQKKEVYFAQLIEVLTPSPERNIANCPHYEKCAGCHFQHTSYQNELLSKKKALEWQLRSLPHPEVQIFKAPHREKYRNRIQLHYNVKTNQIGFMNRKKIIPIENCLLADPQIEDTLRILLQNWNKTAPKSSGHVEISLGKGKEHPQISWDAPYSAGGFQQVNFAMNKTLNEEIFKELETLNPENILDLFGGSGNLTAQFHRPTLVVDKEIHKSHLKPHQTPFECDLSLANSHLKLPKLNFDCLVIDPPRAGYSQIQELCDYFQFPYIVSISCRPDTLARDLSKLPNYKIKSLKLLDLFPSTYHFESLVLLQRCS